MNDLHPQSFLKGSIKENLLNIIEITKYEYDKKIDIDKWKHFIDSYNGSLEVHHTVLFNNGVDAPWIWTYNNDGHIELTIKKCRKSDLDVSDIKIKSPSICGDWWCKITNISIKETTSDTVVTFTPKDHIKMPTLIRYCEDADLFSILYIGIFCLLQSNVNFYISFMTIAAEKGLSDAEMHLWKYYYHTNQVEKAVHWLSIQTLQHYNLQSSLCLSQILCSTNSPIKNYSLSEHILIKILNDQGVNKSFKNLDSTNDICIDAMITLGKIYLLDGTDDAPHNTELGMKLLEISSNIANIPEAQQSINKYKQEKENSSISTIDIIISTGIAVAAFCAIGFFISKKR